MGMLADPGLHVQPDPTDLELAAIAYVHTFAGRRDAFSLWTGEHWQAIRRPLRGRTALTAFETGVPISSYFLDADNQTHVACLDIDRDDGLKLGYRFGSKLAKLGGLGYLEPSRRGCHFWMVLGERRPGILVRRALKQLVKEAGLPADPKIELRPGSDRLNGEGLGHCLRMPTMPHHKSGKRYSLISNDGEKLSGKLVEMMQGIEYCSVTVFDDAAERAPLPKLTGAPRDLKHPHGDPPVDDSVCAILRELFGVPNARPNIAVKCPCHEDRRPSLQIFRDDQRVLCHSPSCELHNDGRGRGTRELRAIADARRGK